MPPDQMFAFFIFALVAAITPGPSNVMLMVAGASGGIVGGLRCLAGVVVGMAAMMSAASLGLGSLAQAYPPLLDVLTWCGVVFLCWLGWKVASAPPLADQAHRGEPVGFWQALAFQWINPKSWIASVSAAATYGARVDAPAAERALWLGAVFAAAAVPSCFAWLVCGAAMQRWLTNARRWRVFSVTMGVALLASVVFVVR